ncbi:hypothetical protein [Phycisphaera mikurensis]|uniref:RNA polymerase sigma factor 70 region 4 type 2 domain-containing protein n=1 Tax=Phycisphaera mikurensis (strain NBRC 102666 / KCTC 22515 / FYK2301M01) TaxID=1142394 RepID=I0IDI7_PHYMF|nr:hypothetical protein [Phycisphaera mikurensis]MBB6441145.1 DNA-directed RNA polymerase specialized sigma24 family protein [Phycisphaera mikurensis]BAM03325.1 hypothetical protein PSMK_11660 [Phycisphaera mikurensis NBRC 102666]
MRLPHDPIRDNLHDLVRGLDGREKAIVMLYYADELQPEEVSAVMELPVTVITATLRSFRASAATILAPRLLAA